MASEPVFMPATQELAEKYFGGRPPFTFRGHVAVLDGEVIGVGGVYRAEGLLWAFSAMKEPMRAFRKARAKATRLLVSFLDEQKEPSYAIADPKEPTSEGLLRKVGFVPTGSFFRGHEILRRP